MSSCCGIVIPARSRWADDTPAFETRSVRIANRYTIRKSASAWTNGTGAPKPAELASAGHGASPVVDRAARPRRGAGPARLPRGRLGVRRSTYRPDPERPIASRANGLDRHLPALDQPGYCDCIRSLLRTGAVRFKLRRAESRVADGFLERRGRRTRTRLTEQLKRASSSSSLVAPSRSGRETTGSPVGRN